MTLEQIFLGHEDALNACVADFGNERSASFVARDHIAPILADLEDNAGQPLDPTYVAYLILHEMNEKLRKRLRTP